MGYRTVVILYNDQQNQWQHDRDLGDKIAEAIHRDRDLRVNHLLPSSYGRVVECVHADTETLAIIESYAFHDLAHGQWSSSISHEDRSLDLLKQAADKLGYRLVKKKS